MDFTASLTSSRLSNTSPFSLRGDTPSSCPYITLETSPKLTPPQNWRAMSSTGGDFLGHTGSLKFSPPPPTTVCLQTCSGISRGEFFFPIPCTVKVETVRYPFPFPLWKWKSLSCVRLFATPQTIQYGILQARILKWVAFPFSRRSFQPRDQTQVSLIDRMSSVLWLGAERQWWAASLSNHIPESTEQVVNYRRWCQFPPSEWNHTRS